MRDVSLPSLVLTVNGACIALKPRRLLFLAEGLLRFFYSLESLNIKHQPSENVCAVVIFLSHSVSAV